MATESGMDHAGGWGGSWGGSFRRGTTRPAETMSLVASSMVRAESMTREDSTTMTRPVMGWGAVGMTTLVRSWRRRSS